MVLIAASLILTVLYVIVVLYFRMGWLRIPAFRVPDDGPLLSVNILIAARNEEACIGSVIEDVLKQTYPAQLFQLIIIDDHSTDNTSEIVLKYASRGVKLIKLNEKEPLNSYKKKAISEAIHLSQGELIITTDADCRMGPGWLETVVSGFKDEQVKMISSPVVYHEERSFFERLQTLEFCYLIGLGASTIGNKMPSTCNGANLAYRRSVFVELGGFKGIDDLASGDDELFLHKVAARYPDGIRFCKAADALVYTDAKATLPEFISQRKRWASKSTRYTNKWVVALGVSVWLFNALILLNVLMGFYKPLYWQLLAAILLLKFFAEAAFLLPVTHFFKRRELLLYLPLLTLIHSVYMVYIGIAGNSGKYVWKGRLVR